MKKVLYITANPNAEELSYSLKLGKEFLKAYREVNPADEIIHLDLYQADIPLIDGDVLSAWRKSAQYSMEETSAGDKQGDGLTVIEKEKIERINQLTDQFISMDRYIFVSPMWNFSIPPKLKAYIDTICIARKTFAFTENGAVGLLQGRKAVHIQAGGGSFSGGPMDFSSKYLQSILGFLGLEVTSIIAEGMAMTPEKAQDIFEEAVVRSKEAVKQLA
ncbi:FMN-dependent NADH-azoreductase [Caldalkalibacillus mannanilyticus]|uniref:FMN-dependent NADH-azoreductase n=1 Tax=Caldalkalibacillus mannanilyticus TaxID=1418 RepID=UPI00046A834F|nr:NAD(P)H-dependent oxidoreductase [Caldalkalibacillus mannanilyticus]